MHSQFNIYKSTLKAHVKFNPTCFGSQMEPSSGGQQLILAEVHKWFNGGSPYSQYCGGIRKLQWKTYLLKQQVKSYMCINGMLNVRQTYPMCVYC
jgi:hypothetical protein